jgi:hypothetical protein
MPKPHSSVQSADTLPLLSPRSREILALYASALPEVRFPDLDLASLHASADQLREAEDEVDRLESELRDARELVASRNAALDMRAERALAYARIYAEGKPELQAQLSAVRVHAGNEGEAPSSRRRGRPRKHETHEGQLHVLESAAE